MKVHSFHIFVLLILLAPGVLQAQSEAPGCHLDVSQRVVDEASGHVQVTVTLRALRSYEEAQLSVVLESEEPYVVEDRSSPPLPGGIVRTETLDYFWPGGERGNLISIFASARIAGPTGRSTCDYKAVVSDRLVSGEAVITSQKEEDIGVFYFSDIVLTEGFQNLYSSMDSEPRLFYCLDSAHPDCDNFPVLSGSATVGDRIRFTGLTYCPGPDAGSCGVLMETVEILLPAHESRLDVNRDGSVSPIDALLIINEINDRGARPIDDQEDLQPFDTNADGYISPIDALLVLNLLNEQSSVEGAEGELERGVLLSGDGSTTVRAEINEICLNVRRAGGLFTDFDQDGKGSLRDLRHYLSFVGIPVGDVNLDGKFDSNDLVEIFQHGKYEKPTLAPALWSDGDFTCDGQVNSADMVLALQGR